MKEEIKPTSEAVGLEAQVIPAYEFTWQNYIGTKGYGSTECWNFDTNKPKDGFEIIGKIDAMKLQVRPRPGTAVLLFDIENEEDIWLHI